MKSSLRRLRDSNSRYSFPYTNFPGLLLKPLGQVSNEGPNLSLKSRILKIKRHFVVRIGHLAALTRAADIGVHDVDLLWQEIIQQFIVEVERFWAGYFSRFQVDPHRIRLVLITDVSIAEGFAVGPQLQPCANVAINQGVCFCLVFWIDEVNRLFAELAERRFKVVRKKLHAELEGLRLLVVLDVGNAQVIRMRREGRKHQNGHHPCKSPLNRWCKSPFGPLYI